MLVTSYNHLHPLIDNIKILTPNGMPYLKMWLTGKSGRQNVNVEGLVSSGHRRSR